MAFQVIWSPAAEARLAKAWLEADDRSKIDQAARSIDDALTRVPLALGESRSGDERIVFDGPLGCSYRVDGNLQMVYVISIWRVVRKA
jgi:plasmid stabilization system protein ParE